MLLKYSVDCELSLYFQETQDSEVEAALMCIEQDVFFHRMVHSCIMVMLDLMAAMGGLILLRG